MHKQGSTVTIYHISNIKLIFKSQALTCVTVIVVQFIITVIKYHKGQLHYSGDSLRKFE